MRFLGILISLELTGLIQKVVLRATYSCKVFRFHFYSGDPMMGINRSSRSDGGELKFI